MPWWAALRTLTGDVMRRALWVGGIDRSEARSSCFASIKGEDTTPAIPAKVFKSATTLHRSSERANTNPGERAAGQNPRRKGGGHPDRRHGSGRMRPRARKRTRRPSRNGERLRSMGARGTKRTAEGARTGAAGRGTRSVEEKGDDAAANAMDEARRRRMPRRVARAVGYRDGRAAATGERMAAIAKRSESGEGAPRRSAAGWKASIYAMVCAVIGLLLGGLGCYWVASWVGYGEEGARGARTFAKRTRPTKRHL